MRYSTAASGEHSDNSIRRSPSPRRSPGNSNRGSGICFEYAKKGSCKHGNKCKYKHEKPRDRSHSSRSGRSSSRSSFHSSRSRRSSSGSVNRTDKSQVPCRYFKKGHCRRGDSCPFKHESTSPSAAAPTRERAGSPHRPSPKVIGGIAVAEVRGVGEVAEVIAKADVVAEIVGRENHHPEARVLKTAPVHHASTMRVLSSKMITGKCPKAEMWLLDTTSTTEMSGSIHVAPSVHFQPACCLILVEQDMIKKIMQTHVSKTIGDSTILTNPLTAGRGRQSFA